MRDSHALSRALLLALPFLLGAHPALAWGPAVHQAVTTRAIDTLPGQLKSFYRNHRLEMPTLALEAAAPVEEGPDRRFAVDRLLPFPFTDLPRSEAALKQRFGEAANGVGRLPWLIQESYARLLDAMRSGDRARILEESDLLAALVTDLHNPLALTDNADGQRTGQHGLWTRFATKFPEAAQRALRLDPDAAHYLDDPREFVFAMLSGTYVWVDNLLYQEELAHRGLSGYGELYYEALANRASDLIRQRLSLAAGSAGSYWYTAWTAAGRPELK
jgi:hypothetical protein